jgi:hypothetical protein
MLGAGMTGSGGVASLLHVRQGEFKELEFKKKALKFSAEDGPEHVYFIYKSAKECTEVKATSAKEAIEKSGIAHPHRIIRADMVKQTILTESAFLAPESVPPAQATPAAQTVEEKVATPQDSAKNAPAGGPTPPA